MSITLTFRQSYWSIYSHSVSVLIVLIHNHCTPKISFRAGNSLPSLSFKPFLWYNSCIYTVYKSKFSFWTWKLGFVLEYDVFYSEIKKNHEGFPFFGFIPSFLPFCILILSTWDTATKMHHFSVQFPLVYLKNSGLRCVFSQSLFIWLH